MNYKKSIFWISSVGLSLMMVMSAMMFLTDEAGSADKFESLGFPAFLVLPLAIAKLAGVYALWGKTCWSLKHWAHGGFFLLFLIAMMGHVEAGDGEWMGAGVAMLMLIAHLWSSDQCCNREDCKA